MKTFPKHQRTFPWPLNIKSEGSNINYHIWNIICDQKLEKEQNNWQNFDNLIKDELSQSLIFDSHPTNETLIPYVKKVSISWLLKKPWLESENTSIL